MSLSRTRKKSRRRTLLDTPPRQPLTFLSAPRNPIPHQEIRPIDTPRISLGSQRVGQGGMPLSRVPLQAIAGQPVTPQPLQRVSFEKQLVSLPPLEQPVKPSASSASHSPFAPHTPFEPLGIASPKRPLPLQQIKLPASRLKPLAAHATQPAAAFDLHRNSLTPYAARPAAISASHRSSFAPLAARYATTPLAAGHAAAPAFAEDTAIPAHCLTETRLPLQGQQVDLRPISAVQQPVITRASRVITSRA